MCCKYFFIGQCNFIAGKSQISKGDLPLDFSREHTSKGGKGDKKLDRGNLPADDDAEELSSTCTYCS
jgi:hypothetical protein